MSRKRGVGSRKVGTVIEKLAPPEYKASRWLAKTILAGTAVFAGSVAVFGVAPQAVGDTRGVVKAERALESCREQQEMRIYDCGGTQARLVESAKTTMAHNLIDGGAEVGKIVLVGSGATASVLGLTAAMAADRSRRQALAEQQRSWATEMGAGTPGV